MEEGGRRGSCSGECERECATCFARRNHFYFACLFLMLCLCVHAGISPWQPQARSSCRQKALSCCTSCLPSNKTKTLGRSCWRLSRCVHVSLSVSGCVVTLCMFPCMSFCHCMGVTVYTSVTLYSYHTVCNCHCVHVTLCVCLLYVTLHAVQRVCW